MVPGSSGRVVGRITCSISKKWAARVSATGDPYGGQLSDTLREQMLASAGQAVNALCTWAHDELMADFCAREEHVLNVGRELLATWLGQLASAAGPRTPA